MTDKDAEIAHTEMLLREAAESGDYIEMTEEEWDRIEREAITEAAERFRRDRKSVSDR